MNLLATIGNGLRQLIGLVLPVFAKAGDLRKLAPALRWVLRLVVLAVFLVGLWVLSRVLELQAVLPWAPQWLQPVWLPLLGLLFVAICWLGWWVWQLLRPEEEVSNFPDIDEAWQEAVRALNQAGMDAAGAPLFLVLGRPAAPEEALFKAADLRPAVRQAPTRPDAPVHVYAFRDGRYDSIFVSCAGASLLGRQAAILNGMEDAGTPAPPPDGAFSEGGDSMGTVDLSKTARPAGEVKEVMGIIRDARRQGRELTEEEQEQIRRLERKGRPSILKDPAEVELAAARLRHLCRLIQRERGPYCPANGLVVLLPWLATDSDTEAAQTSTVCQNDLAAVRQVFHLNCPVVGMLCDMEKAPGFREFIERFPAERRKQRLGQRFPLVADLDREDVPAKIESGATWICQSLFPTWIYKFLRLELPGEGEPGELTRGNAQLVKLLAELRERHKRLGQILARGVAAAHKEELPLFAGCYVAATGVSPSEQAFVAGVFRKVIENQNYVSWNAEALADDSQYRTWTKVGYAGIGAIALAAIVLGIIFRPGK